MNQFTTSSGLNLCEYAWWGSCLYKSSLISTERVEAGWEGYIKSWVLNLYPLSIGCSSPGNCSSWGRQCSTGYGSLEGSLSLLMGQSFSTEPPYLELLYISIVICHGPGTVDGIEGFIILVVTLDPLVAVLLVVVPLDILLVVPQDLLVCLLECLWILLDPLMITLLMALVPTWCPRTSVTIWILLYSKMCLY